MRDQNITVRTRFEALLSAILERLTKIERRLDDVAVDVDEIDRFNRPYGDGTKLRRRTR